MITYDPDKFGFYTVGNFKTFSKLEALQRQTKTGSEVKWNFNETVFKGLDWSKNPEIDLWTLYKERAKQIRDAYDYVVLFYSGGSDSHNLLLSWIDANCKIDEIATTWNYNASKNMYDHHNIEITYVVFPDIKKLKNSGIEFKYRLIDISQCCLDVFETWKYEYEYNTNFHLSPNNPAKHLLRDKIQDYKDIIDSGKKLVFVWGKEKPMFYEDVLTFYDNIDNCVGPYVQNRYHEGWYDELFYWTPDFPIIILKQYHIIRNFLKYADKSVSHMFNENPNRNGYSKRLDKYISDKTIKKLIYPKWSNNIFCDGKASSFIYSKRDEWFLNSNLSQTKRFNDIVNTYVSNIDGYNTLKGGLLPMRSGNY
jgi:hypothetical protein